MSRKKRNNGTDVLMVHRVPMPLLEHYNEQDEIVLNDPLPRFDTPLLRKIPRLPACDVIMDWKSIHDMEEGSSR